MKKAIWIPALVILFFIGDRIGAWVLQQLVAKSQFRYSRLYTGKAASDILLLGNSRGLIFYQPYIEKITGKKTLNLSYNSLPIDIGKVLIANYLEQYTPPSLLIIDVTMCDRVNEQLITGFAPYTAYSSALDELIKKTSLHTWWATKITHLYRFNGEIFQRCLNYLNKTDEDWLLDRIICKNMQETATTKPVIELKTSDYLLKELSDLINLAEQRGIKVTLVVNPYYPSYAERMQSLPAFIQQIENATGKEVKNYALALKEVEGFGDYQHLNKKGSQTYLSILANDGVFDGAKLLLK